MPHPRGRWSFKGRKLADGGIGDPFAGFLNQPRVFLQGEVENCSRRRKEADYCEKLPKFPPPYVGGYESLEFQNTPSASASA